MPAASPAQTAAKWISIAAGVPVAGYLLWLFYIYLASEAVIERRYTLPSSLVKASIGADAVAHGKRLMTLDGCFGCHGSQLTGKTLHPLPDFTIESGSLRALGDTYSDGDFERAIRRGLMPDARAVWIMPSGSYAYMHQDDVEDIIAYIRSLPPAGVLPSRPDFNLQARRAILEGTLVPTSPNADQILTPADEGPQFDGGRYLAMTACSICHGGDLTGSVDGTSPDLDVATDYTREQFFNLMRRGWSRDGRPLKVMNKLAAARFHILFDYEIEALYKYLVARKTLPPVPKPFVTGPGH
jgi:mono/diheme cytochrome c family protein